MNTKPQTGDIIPFGEYNWRVLDVQEDRALIITENIIEQRAYHRECTYISWETCDLREYLNGEFLSKFDSSRIVPQTIQNPNNPWCGTRGGNPTDDKIFLLSLDEIVKYFGDSGQLQNRPKNDGRYSWHTEEYAFEIDDKYNIERVSKYKNTTCWWWLRSPGKDSNYAAMVYAFGDTGAEGMRVNINVGGVRPALWLKLCGGNEKA